MKTLSYERALAVDYDAQPFRKFGHCVGCGGFTYCRGSSATAVRCFPCHCDQPAVRRRAQRRSHA